MQFSKVIFFLISSSHMINAFIPHFIAKPLKITGRYMNSDSKISNPSILKLDETNNLATIEIILSPQQTQSAFDKSCELYNEEVKTRGYKVPGFRPGAKLPTTYLYQMFGESNVKGLCSSLLANDIQTEADKTGLILVGRGRVVDFKADSFTPGTQHTIQIEVDLWPKITYNGNKDGYKGLSVTVSKAQVDTEKLQKVKDSIRERYKILTPCPVGYSAKMGDVLMANMKGYELGPDGSKGAALPNLASGDGVEIFLEKGKFMDGMIEGLEGAQTGQTRKINVKFPVRPSGPGAALSGKEALFEVEVISVKTRELPEWNSELAARVREGMTLDDLNNEVNKALEGESENNSENIRNEALAKALLERMQVNKLPESLLDETVKDRFSNMLMDFKEQGSTEEQLKEMATPEKYEKYKEISMPNAEKIVKLGLAFRDIAEKEKIIVSETEIKDQLDLINMQSKQKGEQPPDEKNARDQIENTLLRRKVFDFIASSSQITWVEPEPI